MQSVQVCWVNLPSNSSTAVRAPSYSPGDKVNCVQTLIRTVKCRTAASGQTAAASYLMTHLLQNASCNHRHIWDTWQGVDTHQEWAITENIYWLSANLLNSLCNLLSLKVRVLDWRLDGFYMQSALLNTAVHFPPTSSNLRFYIPFLAALMMPSLQPVTVKH